MNPQPTNKLMKKALLLAAHLIVALPGTSLADPPVEPGQPPIIQIFPGPRAVSAPAPAIAIAKMKSQRRMSFRRYHSDAIRQTLH